MNITALYTLYLLYSTSQLVSEDITVQVAKSLRYVIDNYFTKYSSSFVLIISCPRLHTWYYFRDLTEDLFNYDNSIKVQLVMNDLSASYIGPGERNFNLIFVDCADSFINIDAAFRVKNYDINEYYFVLVQNRDRFLPEDIQRILDYCWKHYIINVDILIQTASGELIVYTYFPFTPTHCGKVIPVEINRYRNGRMDSEDIFPQKLLNMYQCPLKVALWNIPPFITIDAHKKGEDAIGGFEGELLKALSEFMNFRIDYKVLPNTERGKVSDNGTTGALRMLETKRADLGLGFFINTIARSRILTATDTYYQSREIFVVLQKSPNYLKPEMIFYPFSPSIWVIVIVTFLLVLTTLNGTIYWARRNSLDVSKIAMKNIWMHFFAMTLGMASILSPRRYFGKLFVTTWMLCTLVLRTQYQALIYHLIRHNFFEHPPGSLDEVIQQRYTFIMNHLTYDALSSVPFFHESNLEVKSIGSIELGSVFSYIEDHSDEKLVAVEPNEFFLHYGAESRKAGIFAPLPESMLVQSACIYLTKHSFLIDRINGLIRSMSSCGLITSWANKALHLSYFMVPLEAKQSTIGHHELKVAFYLCGMLLAFSFVIFLLEIISARNDTLRKAFEKL